MNRFIWLPVDYSLCLYLIGTSLRPLNRTSFDHVDTRIVTDGLFEAQPLLEEESKKESGGLFLQLQLRQVSWRVAELHRRPCT